MKYDVSGGRIQTWALECQIVDHCNLRCAQCCTLSPWLPKLHVDPEILGRDLRALAAVLEPRVFKLTGGEPTLHPDLVGCLRAARESGIAAELSMTTNGFLLQRCDPEVFEILDRLTLSWYRSRELSPKAVDWIEARCDQAKVALVIKPTEAFQQISGVPDSAAAVFDACWMKRRCHSVRAGTFYTCTRPPHVAAVRGVPEEDGVAVHAPDLFTRLHAYLHREEPLQSCAFCLGDTGAWEDHRQIPASELAAERTRLFSR